MFHSLALAALVALAAPLAAQDAPPGDDPLSGDPLSQLLLAADTSSAALRIEQARLALAIDEHAAVSGWRRWRPGLDLFVSVSTRGLAFPSLSARGYDPAAAAIARWPGDTWGLTLSWSVDQVLDRRSVQRAHAAVALAEARIDLHHARRRQQESRDRERAVARARRDADRQAREARERQRARLVADQLRLDDAFLARRLDAQRELLRLAELTYRQGESDYAALARQRLAVLAAEHAQAANAARLTALDAGGLEACPSCATPVRADLLSLDADTAPTPDDD